VSGLGCDVRIAVSSEYVAMSVWSVSGMSAVTEDATLRYSGVDVVQLSVFFLVPYLESPV
jgi:hypothetical protein